MKNNNAKEYAFAPLFRRWLAEFKAAVRYVAAPLAVACLAACTPPKATPAPAPACAPTPFDTRCVCNTADASHTQDAGDAAQ